MKINVIRHATSGGATVGTLSIDGLPQCFTLEDPVREVEGAPVESWKIKGETAIPRGTYSVAVSQSGRWGRLMPILLGVPGFDSIRIHPGNTSADTEGCILVGYGEGTNTVGRSRDAFRDFYVLLEDALDAGELVTITIN